MRCSKCGHESPAGSSFCLNCGSSLSAGFAQTPAAAAGLPGACPVCRGENPPGMKFCRSCGASLPAAGFGGPMPGMGGIAPGPLAAPPAMAPPGGYAAGGLAGRNVGYEPTMMPMAPPPTQMAPPPMAPQMAPPPPAQGSMIACPHCGTQTPLGFAYCQQCGHQIQPAGEPTRPPAKLDAPIDPHAGTLAQDGMPPAVRIAISSPRPQTAATGAWGTAVLVNRDGSDGQRFALAGEYLVIGRAGSDIAFDEDRFLARQHARLEYGPDGIVRIHPIDTLNGVFRKADAPVELADGMTVLVGREVLRFERVAPEEAKPHPLVRHGVALFGSPPRDPWGRFVQLVPSGGHRDVRHLASEEIVLGREEGDLVFRDDAFMSRRHAAVTWDGRRAHITDLGSSNGTFVRITTPTALRHGDHVRLGDQLLRLELGR